MITVPLNLESQAYRLTYERDDATNIEEVKWLCWKASQTPGDILEIGCHAGRTARELAHHCPSRHVWTVDLLECPTMSDGQLHEMPTLDIVGWRARYLPNVSLLLCGSSGLDFGQLPGISFVFIDGDHRFEGVKHDSELALSYFEKNFTRPACIAWHDYEVHPFNQVNEYLNTREDLPLSHVAGTRIAYLDFSV